MIFLRELDFCLDGGEYLGKKTVTGLVSDSRRCKKGYLFFCKGGNFKPEYACDALMRGACAIVCCKKDFSVISGVVDPKEIIAVDDVMAAMSCCAQYFYGYPMKRLISVAVTGTKGKSTTAYYVNSAINKQKGMKSALLCDLVNHDSPRLTTPEPLDFHEAAARAIDMGCTHIVCEISSQAQKVGRTHGVIFDIGCFLNLGNDHISPCEHKSMQEYFDSKRSLFDQCKTALVNVDDKYGKELFGALQMSCRKISVSRIESNADYYAENIKTDDCGCDLFVCKGTKNKIWLMTFALGEHSAQNVLMAAALLDTLGVEYRAIFDGILSGEPSGRGEIFRSKNKAVTVIVDYAHNEMSFLAMLNTVNKEFFGATVTVIFGCPGDKAYCRREQLVKITADNADKVIVCEDDSGREGYEAISGEIRGYFEKIKAGRLRAVSYIKSRSVALRCALDGAADDCGEQVILMLGKGGERVNRACGFDEVCVPDAEIAKAEIARFDKIISERSELSLSIKSKNTCVCIEDGADAESLAQAFSLLRGNMHKVIAVCKKSCFSDIAKKCFFHGVSTINIDEKELLSSHGVAAKKVRGAARRGALPIFTCKEAEKSYCVRVCEAVKAEQIVYLTSDGGILLRSGAFPRRITLRRAVLANEHQILNDVANVRRAIEHGVKTVSYIDGKQNGALLSCLRDSGCGYVEICGDK